MGCTTGHLACQPQPQTSGQEGQSLEVGGAKVPDVLSSLERLSQATGGMEKSWYRCIFPFGIISLVIGVAGTGVTYTYNDLPQTKVVSVVLLIMGVLLLLMATACWTVHKKKRRKKKEGGSFTSEQCPLHSGSSPRHSTRYAELLLESMLASLDTSVTAFLLPGQVTLQEATSGPKTAT
ncbi:hypothetical protein NQZ68_030980 [Scomber scombrus]|uniref:Transmembrane protein 100 n=2 Tax=Scomber scombrus TaxID=13677 RepID=A0AAV1NUS1_SCOSC